jgi:hypothetical protein
MGTTCGHNITVLLRRFQFSHNVMGLSSAQVSAIAVGQGMGKEPGASGQKLLFEHLNSARCSHAFPNPPQGEPRWERETITMSAPAT